MSGRANKSCNSFDASPFSKAYGLIMFSSSASTFAVNLRPRGVSSSTTVPRREASHGIPFALKAGTIVLSGGSKPVFTAILSESWLPTITLKRAW